MKESKPNAARSYLNRMGSDASRRTQRQALRVLAGLLGCKPGAKPEQVAWHRLTYARTSTLRMQLANRYAPATANRILAALRGTLKEAWRLGLMAAEEYHRAADLPGVRGSGLQRGRALDPAEVAALYRACAADPTPAGRRDGAVVALLHAAGLRRAEAVLLDLAAVDRATGAIVVRGKGRKQRRTFLGAGLAWVLAWIQVRGDAPGPLLCEVRGKRVDLEERLSEWGLYRAVVGRAADAGLEHVACHDLRRTFATRLLEESGGDIDTVSRLLGHASLDTTRIYDRRGESAKRDLQSRLRIPPPPAS
jgi:site-specific recombinase XerD